MPATAIGLPLPPGAAAVILLLFMSLTVLMARGRWTLAAGLGTFLLTGVSVALQGMYPGLIGRITAECVGALTFGTLFVVVFGAAFGPGRFNSHRVRGAIALYLTVGLFFAFLHRIMAEAVPGAYSNLPDQANVPAFRAAIDYFSFTTLTSLGYGDIVPVHPVAHSLATLEAMLGQLYPATLLARVVSLEMASRELD